MSDFEQKLKSVFEGQQPDVREIADRLAAIFSKEIEQRGYVKFETQLSDVHVSNDMDYDGRKILAEYLFEKLAELGPREGKYTIYRLERLRPKPEQIKVKAAELGISLDDYGAEYVEDRMLDDYWIRSEQPIQSGPELDDNDGWGGGEYILRLHE